MKKGQRDQTEKTPVPERPDGDAESFGAWLQRQRLGRGIELQEIADTSKISLQYLKAFEANRFDLLPAGLFARGFLRQYAGFVGLDPEEVVNFFLAACQAEEDENPPETNPQHAVGRGTSPLRFVAVTLVVIAFLVAMVWWLGGIGSAEPQVSDANGATPSGSAAYDDRTSDSTASGPRGTPPVAAAPGETDAMASETVPETLSPAQASPDAQTLDLASALDDSSALRVAVDFSANCWVEARVDGQRQVAITKIQGESLLLEAEESVDFVFGNVHAVSMELNGLPFPLTARRGTSRLAVHLDGSILEDLRNEALRTPPPLSVGDGGAVP